MELQLKIVGFLLVLLALIHIAFPRYFNWKNELISLSLINRQLMYVHTFFIALVVLLMGLLCLTSSEEIIETSFGNKIALGLGIFWLVRLLTQFIGYSSIHWKGKQFETIIHVFFSILWIYFSVLFLYVYWVNNS